MRSSRVGTVLLLLFFLFCATFASGLRAGVDEDNAEFLYTVGGAAVPLSLVRNHVPSAPRHVLPHLLFEHMEDGLLVSHQVRLDVAEIAPHVHIPDVSETRVIVDGVHRRIAPRGPTLRFGDNHTFVYDYLSNVMLAAWGPGLHLRPLHLDYHPNILVNVRHGSSLKRLHLAQAPSAFNHQKSTPDFSARSSKFNTNTPDKRSYSHSMNTEEQQDTLQWRGAQQIYRPNFTSESEVFFDIAFAFDQTFCQRFASNPDNVSQVVHSAAVAAHKMALGPVVSVRIGDIIGSCNDDDDPFRRPASVFNCPLSSTTCSRPDMILKAFREAWPGGGVADATYLMSGYEEGSDVVGAAWVAAACNPEYAFGWVEGEYPVIIAHEIAHTLGATHDEVGLMSPALNLSETAILSHKSLNQIQAYLRRIASLNCLSPRHGSSTQNRRRYAAFTRLTLDKVVEGTDVAVISLSSNARVAEVVMLDVRRTGMYGDQLAFSFATIIRDPNRRFPFAIQNDAEPKFFLAKNVPFQHPAGGGIAVAKVIDNIHHDVVVVYIAGGFPQYVIGHKLDPNNGILGDWMNVPGVPINVGSTVQCLGATIGDLSGNGSKDMVIVYIDRKGETYHPYYIVGFDIGANGNAKRWTNPQSLDWTTTEEVSDIGVELIDTTKSGRPDLVISYSEHINGLWAYRITVGYDLAVTGLPSRPWESVTPDLTYNSTSEVEKITGGIAMANMGSNRSTAIIYQSRQISTGNTQWVEIGDDILAEEPGDVPPIIEVVDGVTPLDTCTDCYSEGAGRSQCEERIRQCFAKHLPPQVSTLSGKQQRISTDTSRSFNTRVALLQKPSAPTIICAGFYDVFLAGDGNCRTDVQTADLVSIGAAKVLQEDLNSIEIEAAIYEFIETNYTKVPENLRYLLPGGISGNIRVPKTVDVYFSGKPGRRKVIQAALRKLGIRQDFKSFFTPLTKVRQVNNRKYVVTLKYAQKFQAQLLRQLST